MYILHKKNNKNEVVKKIYLKNEINNQTFLKKYYNSDYQVSCGCKTSKSTVIAIKKRKKYFLVNTNPSNHNVNCENYKGNSLFVEETNDSKAIPCVYHKNLTKLTPYDKNKIKNKEESRREKRNEFSSVLAQYLQDYYFDWTSGKNKKYKNKTFLDYALLRLKYLLVNINKEDFSVGKAINEGKMFAGVIESGNKVVLKNNSVQVKCKNILKGSHSECRVSYPKYIHFKNFQRFFDKSKNSFKEGKYLIVGHINKKIEYSNKLDFFVIENISIIRISDEGLPVDSYSEAEVANRLKEQNFHFSKPTNAFSEYGYKLPDFIIKKNDKIVIIEIFGRKDVRYKDEKEEKKIIGEKMKESSFVCIDPSKGETADDLIKKVNGKR